MLGALVAEVELRNTRRVYEDGSSCHVVQIDRHGQEHTTTIAKETLAGIRKLLRGESWSIDSAVSVVEPDAESLGLTFTYGFKLHFNVQEALVALVALGHATHEKAGRSYIYRVS